jgi:Domain of unknown function (DUF3846)
MAILFKVRESGDFVYCTQESISPENGTDFQLEEMYSLLECEMIEIVYPRDYPWKILIIDEEGKLTGKQVNIPATQIFGYDDVIVGSAILCDSEMVK